MASASTRRYARVKKRHPKPSSPAPCARGGGSATGGRCLTACLPKQPLESQGYDGFVSKEPKLWRSPYLFVDKEKSTYKAVNAKRGSVFGLMRPAVIRAYNAAQGSGVQGNNDNALEGLQLGGTYVIAGDGRMVMAAPQTGFTTHPSNDEVLAEARKAAAAAASE